MSLIFCETCMKNIPKKLYFEHKDIKSNNILLDYFPQDICNIISKYKYQLEIYNKYKKFIKFLHFYDSIKNYETISIDYNCYRVDHFLDDMIYIIKNHYKQNFRYIIRHMISGRKLKNLKINRKIYKLNIEYNVYNKKFYIRYI